MKLFAIECFTVSPGSLSPFLARKSFTMSPLDRLHKKAYTTNCAAANEAEIAVQRVEQMQIKSENNSREAELIILTSAGISIDNDT